MTQTFSRLLRKVLMQVKRGRSKWVSSAQERKTDVGLNPNAGKRSLVLITVDSLRADHCGLYGYSRPTTPFLDSLAPESFIVPTAIVGGAPTYYSLPAILASRMPMALGRDVIGLAPGESTLATVLRNSGYATAAFAASNPYISPRFGYDQGFETFCDFNDFGTQPAQDAAGSDAPLSRSVRGMLNRLIEKGAKAVGLGSLYNELYFQYCMKVAPAVDRIDSLRSYPAADVMVEQAQCWLASVGQRPFFLWLHLMDPHSPYYPPKEAFRDLTGRDLEPNRARYVNAFWNRADLTPVALKRKRDEVVQLYDAGIRWVDHEVARLVDGLKRAQQWDDCVFALTADHGEEFLDHGGRYHPPVHLSEETVHVPLLIRTPGEGGGKVPASPMGHLHLAPTLLECLGVPPPSAFQGRSVLTNFRQGIAWTDPAMIESALGCTNPFVPKNRIAPRLLAVRDTRFKLVMRMECGMKEELYDLESDPSELHPSDNTDQTQVRKKLISAAQEHMKRTIAGRDDALRLRSRLRDLRSEMLG
jgi:arylsulfatase A-like enzyme